jgi:hypothetical protein
MAPVALGAVVEVVILVGVLAVAVVVVLVVVIVVLLVDSTGCPLASGAASSTAANRIIPSNFILNR